MMKVCTLAAACGVAIAFTVAAPATADEKMDPIPECVREVASHCVEEHANEIMDEYDLYHCVRNHLHPCLEP